MGVAKPVPCGEEDARLESCAEGEGESVDRGVLDSGEALPLLLRTPLAEGEKEALRETAPLREAEGEGEEQGEAVAAPLPVGASRLGETVREARGEALAQDEVERVTLLRPLREGASGVKDRLSEIEPTEGVVVALPLPPPSPIAPPTLALGEMQAVEVGEEEGQAVVLREAAGEAVNEGQPEEEGEVRGERLEVALCDGEGEALAERETEPLLV